jgi:hypothetical protein
MWADLVTGEHFFHTDRGAQFTAKDVVTKCGDIDMDMDLVRSMGATGSCCDRVSAEFFLERLRHSCRTRGRDPVVHASI